MTNPQAEQTQAAQQATQAAAQVMTAELFSFLSVLRQRHEARAMTAGINGSGNGKAATNGHKPANGKTPLEQPIEITWEGDTLYQEDSDGIPRINRLGLQAVDLLQVALEQAPGERVSQQDNPSFAVQIGEADVLRVENGVVTRNDLSGQMQQPTNDFPAWLSALQTGMGSSSPMALPVSIQEPLTFQVQRSRGAPPSILERLDNTAAKDLAEHPPWMKLSLQRKVSEAVVKRLPKLRRQRVADTAIDLLQKYGTRQGKAFVYESEGYVLRGEGNRITAFDRQERKLFSLHSRVLGPPKVVEYYLAPSQEADFLSVHQRIKQSGLRGLAKDPLVRSQQLGLLAPAGDTKLTQDLQGLAVVDVARRLLEVGGSAPDRQGNRVLEGSQYRIVQSPQGLTIAAKERGEILKLEGGSLTSQLTAQDVRHFIFVARELSRELKQVPLTAALQQRLQIGNAMQR